MRENWPRRTSGPAARYGRNVQGEASMQSARVSSVRSQAGFFQKKTDAETRGDPGRAVSGGSEWIESEMQLEIAGSCQRGAASGASLHLGLRLSDFCQFCAADGNWRRMGDGRIGGKLNYLDQIALFAKRFAAVVARADEILLALVHRLRVRHHVLRRRKPARTHWTLISFS